MSFHQIDFLPLLPSVFLFIATATLLVFTMLSWLMTRSKSKTLIRALFCAVILVAISQPVRLIETRKNVKDILLVARDKSLSQDFGQRREILDHASTRLSLLSKEFPNIETRFIDVASNADTETAIFKQIETALADIPENRRAGVILLSDGQVADTMPPDETKAPFHLILTGSRRDKDRSIKILNSPAYGVIGENVHLKFRIEDSNINSSSAAVTVTFPDGKEEKKFFQTNTDHDWALPILQPGQNVFEIAVEDVENELTLLNNHAIVETQGIRNRLHVLLVSGEPYPGARMWRDLLKADPGIDLVHFTILRSPEKIDNTPTSELSLIAFPFEELFERKLGHFDLIIMDRFGLNALLPDYYFENIKNYVENGGALLEINGAGYSSKASLYNTSLGAILPGAPDGGLIQSAFKPEITALGKSHPVTMPLMKYGDWGQWLQQIPVRKTSGDTLMSGIDGLPLLILSREGQGRIAQMTSDQIWLWARGYQGGGPTTELLRRTVHWLMKEPELDENALTVQTDENNITIRYRNKDQQTELRMTKPDGSEEILKTTSDGDGWLTSSIHNPARGIYKFSSGQQRKLVATGNLTTTEFSEIVTTDRKLKKVITKTGGGVIWAEDQKEFGLRHLENRRSYSGSGWLGLKKNNASDLLASKTIPILSEEAWLAIILLCALLLWWNESRRTQLS